MLQMSILDFLVTAVPEGMIYILALYVLCKEPIDKKKYLLASGLHMLMIFGIRLLPISYGIHTILLMVSLSIIGITINKLKAIAVIKATIFTVILQFISESVSFILLQQITGQEIGQLVKHRSTKVLVIFMSLVILVGIILTIRRRYDKSVKCGENSQQIS